VQLEEVCFLLLEIVLQAVTSSIRISRIYISFWKGESYDIITSTDFVCMKFVRLRALSLRANYTERPPLGEVSANFYG
jgi:hypothetical protein